MGLFEDENLFYVGEIMSVNNGESLKVNFMTRLKRHGPEVDKLWIFPGEPDCHTIQTSSVIDIVPQLDLDLNLTSSRVVVMVLNITTL